MKYAIVKNGVVVNIASANRALSADWVQAPIGAGVSIGDRWDGAMFYDASNSPRLTPEAQATQEYIKNLEQDNARKDELIKSLTDRVDLAEDCIAEMAMIVYA